MSETVLETGKLVKQDLGQLTKEEYYQKKCGEKGIKTKSDSETWQDVYTWEFGFPVTLNDITYDVIPDKEKGDPDYYVKLIEQPDGTIDFTAIYYNGGGSLSEVLESEYKKMKK